MNPDWLTRTLSYLQNWKRQMHDLKKPKKIQKIFKFLRMTPKNGYHLEINERTIRFPGKPQEEARSLWTERMNEKH